VLVALLGIALIALVRGMLSSELTIEHQKRGASLTTHLAAMATDYVLTNDRLSLNMIIEDYKDAEEDIEYIFVLDNNGLVLVHSFADGFPVDLRTANNVMPEQKYNIQTLITEDGSVFDMAVPILKGEAGVVRIGLSAEPIREAVDRITMMAAWIIVIVFIAGLIIASALTITITAPIRELRKASEAIGSGDLSHRVSMRSNDEMGQLSETFNAMAESLQKTNKELEQSLFDKDMLMKEVHHRVKNNLAVIQSLLRLQLIDITDDKSREHFHDAGNRVKSMAMIHELLYRSDDITRLSSLEYIRNLVNTLFHNYKTSTQAIRLQYDIQDIELDVDTMMPLGLIINELVSNALKYAFPDEMNGELSISMKRAGDTSCELVIKDTGVGLPEDLDIKNTKSLGLMIVNSLVNQLRGTSEVSNRGGTEFRIVFAENPIE
jgi:two-component sensor histidine kinase